MWVETKSGNLANLARMDAVQVHKNRNSAGDLNQDAPMKVVAFGQITSNYEVTVEDTLFVGDGAACLAYMERIKEALGEYLLRQ